MLRFLRVNRIQRGRPVTTLALGLALALTAQAWGAQAPVSRKVGRKVARKTPAAKPSVAPSPLPSASASPSPKVPALRYPLDTLLPGPESAYQTVFIEIWKNWKTRPSWNPTTNPGSPVAIRMYRTPGSPYYIGMEKQMLVQAPLARLEAVMDNFDHYRDLFPDFRIIREENRDGNRVEVFFQRGVPVPFVEDIFYRLTYLLDKTDPLQKVYRYHLKESNNLKRSDGLIFLDAISENETRFHAFDFYEADWSVLKIMGADRIWRDTIQGTFLSDLCIKMRAEHPDWTYERIRREREKIAPTFDVNKVHYMDSLQDAAAP